MKVAHSFLPRNCSQPNLLKQEVLGLIDKYRNLLLYVTIFISVISFMWNLIMRRLYLKMS